MRKKIIFLLMSMTLLFTGCANKENTSLTSKNITKQESKNISTELINEKKVNKNYEKVIEKTNEIVEKETLSSVEKLVNKDTNTLNVNSVPKTSDLSNIELDIINLTNEYRLKNGLEILEEDAILTEIARIRAKEIVDTWSHTRPDGTECFDLLEEQGYIYTLAGENLGKHQKTAEEVMQMWIESPSHNENLLDDFDKIGVGVYEDNQNELYFVQIFAK